MPLAGPAGGLVAPESPRRSTGKGGRVLGPEDGAQRRGRSRASAKAAGSTFERLVADYLKAHVSRFIDRMVKRGAKDAGDLVNVETLNELPVAVEVKDYAGRILASEWLREAEVERVNLGAVAGVVVAKRRGVGAPGEQFVLMTLADLAALLSGKRP